MVSPFQHDPRRFESDYKRKLIQPKIIELTGPQVDAAWKSFVSKYVQNGAVTHFSELTRDQYVEEAIGKLKGNKRRIESARGIGTEAGEAAFEKALSLAYELHAMGRSQAEVIAALASELRNPSVESLESSDEKSLRALHNAVAFADDILSRLKHIKTSPEAMENVSSALNEDSFERSASFIRITQFALSIKRNGKETPEQAFERARSEYPEEVDPQAISNVARAYSYMLKFYYNFNPGIVATGNELGEFSVYCENPKAYGNLVRARDQIVGKQMGHINEIAQAIHIFAKKNKWQTLSSRSHLRSLYGGRGENQLVLSARPYPKGILEVVDKAFSRPYKYIDFSRAKQALDRAEKLNTLSGVEHRAINRFNELFDHVYDELTPGHSAGDFNDVFNDRLGKIMQQSASNEWLLLEQILRRSPNLHTVLRLDKFDDILGMRVVALPSIKAHETIHEELFGSGRRAHPSISRQAAETILDEREQLNALANSIHAGLKGHQFRSGAIRIGPLDNRLLDRFVDSRAIGGTSIPKPVRITPAMAAGMNDYCAAHMTVYIDGQPMEVQMMHLFDLHNQYARILGNTAIGYGTERLSRIPVFGGGPIIQQRMGKYLNAYNAIQYRIYRWELEGHESPEKSMRKIEELIRANVAG